jgi:NAD(P)-dependent dehydrogenase (short-subunit alcohol dehydrogenase family)
MSELAGRVALVTGVTGGVGPYVAQALLDAGALVAGTSRKVTRADIPHPNFTAMPAEISSRAAAQSLVDQILARFGRLDILTHMVGGFAGGATVADADEAVFEQMFSLNFYTLLHILQAAIPPLRRSEHGRVVAIGSRAALEPGATVGAYSASKAAAVSLIKTVAAENKDSALRANIILPGTIDTPANRRAMPNADFSKWVRPDSIAGLVTWLVSDAGQDVNGAALPIYGADV